MRTIIILISLMLTLSQCTSYDFAHRLRQQGNLLPHEKIERLRPGMSKEDVAILMGTSLISPLFTNNRWDYAYTLKQGNRQLEIQHVSLYFSGNTLKRIETMP